MKGEDGALREKMPSTPKSEEMKRHQLESVDEESDSSDRKDGSVRKKQKSSKNRRYERRMMDRIRVGTCSIQMVKKKYQMVVRMTARMRMKWKYTRVLFWENCLRMRNWMFIEGRMFMCGLRSMKAIVRRSWGRIRNSG